MLIRYAPLAFIFAFLLNGCSTTSYEFVPPTTEAGRMCTAQCAIAKESCLGDAEAQGVRNKATCEQLSSQEYTSCLINANNAEQKKACQKKKRICIEYASTDRCEKRYRGCFVGCGGRVVEFER